MSKNKIEYLIRLALIKKLYGSYKAYLQQLTGLPAHQLRHIKD